MYSVIIRLYVCICFQFLSLTACVLFTIELHLCVYICGIFLCGQLCESVEENTFTIYVPAVVHVHAVRAIGTVCVSASVCEHMYTSVCNEADVIVQYSHHPCAHGTSENN